jgi:lipoic acid synthetase
LNIDDNFRTVKELNKRLGLNTVCEQAACPNIGICWAKSEVTYILLGKDCTRRCKFCNVKRNKPLPPDKNEPRLIAKAVKELGLSFVVITSVTRDDLPDMGLKQILKTISLVKKSSPGIKLEVLIPDFGNSKEPLEMISNSGVDVVGHNIETVKALYTKLRPGYDYNISLGVLGSLKSFNPFLVTKSALLLGLGEKEAEVVSTIKDLRSAKVDIIYLGQYLSPSKEHWPVEKFYPPEEFEYYKLTAKSLGFKVVISEPLARSSWKAREAYEQWIRTKQ